MALTDCKACKSHISAEATACPNCGHPNKQGNAGAAFQALASIAVLVAAVWYFFGGGMQEQAQNDLNKIQAQVATDAANQYDIAKRQGDKMQTCFQAGMVAAAYLQAKDEAAYQQWKKTEAADCAKAGVPH